MAQAGKKPFYASSAGVAVNVLLGFVLLVYVFASQLHPHCIRHTTAVALLKSGVDFATISQWLGHASLNTTMIYAHVDLDLKRQALAQVFPDALPVPRIGHLTMPEIDIIAWLKRL